LSAQAETIETGSTDAKALELSTRSGHNGNFSYCFPPDLLTLTSGQKTQPKQMLGVAQIDIDPDVPLLVAPAISESLATLV